MFIFFINISASFLLDPQNKYSHGVMTSGLVQQYEHNILPTITPVVTALFVLMSMMVCNYI